jgi:hypothetical protein
VTGDVLKSFLVGLGFDIDDAGLAKFNKAVASATLKVAALYGATVTAATGVAAGIASVSDDFEKLGYEYRLIIPAVNKAIQLRREMLRAYQAAGVNIQKVVVDAVKLNFSLAKTKFAFEAIYKSVASKFFSLLTKQSDAFRQKIYANMPKITAALEKFVKFIFKALEATTQLGSTVGGILVRIYDFFVKLHNATDGWSTVILAVVAAWKFLNLSFLASPLGILLSLGVALLALYDDFKTFREGGKSLIDWGSQTTQIVIGLGVAIAGVAAYIYAAITAMRIWAALAAAVRGLVVAWTAAQWLLNIALGANPIGALILAVGGLITLLGVLYFKWEAIKKSLGTLGSNVLGFLGAPNVAANLAAASGGVPQGAPAGSTTNNSSKVSATLNQQTNINIVGTADAASNGNAVASQQTNVNRDGIRNLRGATR